LKRYSHYEEYPWTQTLGWVGLIFLLLLLLHDKEEQPNLLLFFLRGLLGEKLVVDLGAPMLVTEPPQLDSL
jgi:hypothetical protein